MPESVQFYQEFPLSTGETLLRGAIYRYRDESREQAAARYLSFRIDRETMSEDVQLSVWSNESMLSEAFEGFYLSDLEYGVRTHHDHLRKHDAGARAGNRAGGKGYVEPQRRAQVAVFMTRRAKLERTPLPVLRGEDAGRQVRGSTELVRSSLQAGDRFEFTSDAASRQRWRRPLYLHRDDFVRWKRLSREPDGHPVLGSAKSPVAPPATTVGELGIFALSRTTE